MRWLRRSLRGVLTFEEMGRLNSSFDVVGDIAILRIPTTLARRRRLIADVVLRSNRNLRTVLNQVSPVEGSHRLRKLEWIAGEDKRITVHKEHGCAFEVDVEKTFFTPRLCYERKRIADLVQPHEAVVNMFAGVGTFSILIARCATPLQVYSMDINPTAIQYMRRNVVLNNCQDRVTVLPGDAKEVIEGGLAATADRVLMPLPEKAYDYLGVAVHALRTTGGVVHYYDFVHAGKRENPGALAVARVKERMRRFDREYRFDASRVVRTTGPRWYQVVVDVVVLPT
jgi:tRNA (guanine37-N1)-methyltransferase